LLSSIVLKTQFVYNYAPPFPRVFRRIEIDQSVSYTYHNRIMPNVTLLYAAAMQLGELPKPIKGRMVELLVRLADWPEVSGAKPLSGKLAGRYRLRTGDYRLQFRIEQGAVLVEQVGHRDGFYDEGNE
jgi:mRNA interferase RelE/StbE